MSIINWQVIADWWDGSFSIERRWFVVIVAVAALAGAAVTWHLVRG